MNSTGLLSACVALAASAAADGGGAVLVEDFDDNMADPGWLVFETHPSILGVAETNQRLEFAARSAQGTNALAGYLSTGWALSLDDDFQISVMWSLSVPSAPGGELGLAVARQDVQGDSGPRPFDSGDVYFTYDANADTLAIGGSPNDPDAALISQIRELSGACRLSVLLVGFTDGKAPAFVGNQAFFDDLVVSFGTVVVPCVADINCDGLVATTDLLILLGQWGQEHVPADLDGGSVSISDLLTLLGGWGRCP